MIIDGLFELAVTPDSMRLFVKYKSSFPEIHTQFFECGSGRAFAIWSMEFGSDLRQGPNDSAVVCSSGDSEHWKQ